MWGRGRRVLAPSVCVRGNSFETTARVIRFRIRNQFLLRGSTRPVLLFATPPNRFSLFSFQPTHFSSKPSRFPCHSTTCFSTTIDRSSRAMTFERVSTLDYNILTANCFNALWTGNGRIRNCCEWETRILVFRVSTVADEERFFEL